MVPVGAARQASPRRRRSRDRRTSFVARDEACENGARRTSIASGPSSPQSSAPPIKAADPSLFETVVVDLLVKMGYGGSRKDAGQAIGGRGDEGIDGIIKEDRLGLGVIHIQAKRWSGTVGLPEIQKFAGALDGQRARKGIFITTSEFSKEALDPVERIDKRIVLIGGEALAQLLIEHCVGVATVATYEVRRLDTDYFGPA